MSTPKAKVTLFEVSVRDLSKHHQVTFIGNMRKMSFLMSEKMTQLCNAVLLLMSSPTKTTKGKSQDCKLLCTIDPKHETT